MVPYRTIVDFDNVNSATGLPSGFGFASNPKGLVKIYVLMK